MPPASKRARKAGPRIIKGRTRRSPTELVPSGNASQEAVNHTVCVYVESCDRSHRIDAKGGGPFGGTRNIKLGDRAVGSPQEAVKPIGCVYGGSRDGSRRVDALGGGTLQNAF